MAWYDLGHIWPITFLNFQNWMLLILCTNSLCYIYFSQFIHHILFNVSANQSLYQESSFFQCHIAFIPLLPTILNSFVIPLLTKLCKMVGFD